MWDQRFSGDAYFYGTEPNAFLKEAAADLSAPGDVLCIADGEGRNGVYLATLGHRVTSLDASSVGLSKAARLAAQRNVSLTTVHADLAEFVIAPGGWDGIVSVFCHLPVPLRRRVHQAAVSGLRPGGRFILEAYTPDQIGRGTGGPQTADLMMTLAALRDELAGLTMVHGVETVRPVVEGTGHRGDGAVVQVVAVKN